MIYGDNSKYKVEYIGEKFSKNLISYKAIIIGRYGVGKSTTLKKLMEKEFDNEYEPTMTLDIKNIQAKVNEEIIQFSILDCCGNEKFAEQTTNLFKNVSITVLIYAINDRKSYDDLEKWINILKENSYGNTIFLIGNKNDLEEKEREVTIKEGEEFKNNYDDIKIFMETSALYGNNMDKLLENIAIFIYEKDKKLENEVDKAIRKTITLTQNDFSKKGEKKKKKCC